MLTSAVLATGFCSSVELLSSVDDRFTVALLLSGAEASGLVFPAGLGVGVVGSAMSGLGSRDDPARTAL